MPVKVVGDDDVLIRLVQQRLDRLPQILRDITISASMESPSEAVDLWLVPASSMPRVEFASSKDEMTSQTTGGSGVAYPPRSPVAPTLVIHDLYATRGAASSWGDGIERMVESVIAGYPVTEDSGESKLSHWLHVRDLCDAVADLCTLSEIPVTMSIRGRRGRNISELSLEIELLWSRYRAIKSGDSNAIIDAMGEERRRLSAPSPRIEKSENPVPADLGPLHRALQSANGHGFHPSVPMRVGLMEVIASIVENG